MKEHTKIVYVFMIIFLFTLSNFIQVIDGININGFDKGPSYKPVDPLKKITFVNFDEDSLLDDYSYLAAVPTAVFSDNSKLYSHPLLYYQDPYHIEEDKERSRGDAEGHAKYGYACLEPPPCHALYWKTSLNHGGLSSCHGLLRSPSSHSSNPLRDL